MWRRLGSLSWLLLTALPPTALAHSWEAPGQLVGISVAVDGVYSPLYPAPDGSDRHYLEARRGSAYEVHLQNRTRGRVGVVLVVDGLNVISGQREPDTPRLRPGRMYVLAPWETTTVRGWRTSLRDVRRFTFVEEERSYASRSGKANGKMGWIEARVYREKLPEPSIGWTEPR